MYKYLLCSRYLRTRYIALASIISVMLGVATMIVVNSVMHGFREEMYKRLHGILSDLVLESHGAEGERDPRGLMAEVKHILGDDLEGMTATVHVPAMLSFQVRGQWINKQITLIGIDDATYASVSDFSQYLLHPTNRERLSFQLRENGYDERIIDAGWNYRRARAEFEKTLAEQYRQANETDRERLARQLASSHADENSDDLPSAPPADPYAGAAQYQRNDRAAVPPADPYNVPYADPYAQAGAAGGDAHGDYRPDQIFDPAREQHTGMVLGISIASIRYRDDLGAARDFFLCQPGDDVRVTFPNSGTPPQAVSSIFTVVDFYESKMSEYDGMFAFVPISRLQELRGMVDPMTGVGAVSSVQLKLREGASLAAAADKLRHRFPPHEYPLRIQTWKEMQGPLLAAVQMETTILNILLFLIIAVAGFGILATFFMIVVEKTRDIGIMKSLGAPSGGIMAIFLSYGLLLGMVGAGVGMVIGLLFVANINTIAAGIEVITGQEVFDPTIYYFHSIPTIVDPWTVAGVVAGAMFIAVLASVLPAIRAARLHPVEALRYE